MVQGFEYNQLNFEKVAEFFMKISRIFENLLCEKIIYQAKKSLLCYPRQHVT